MTIQYKVRRNECSKYLYSVVFFFSSSVLCIFVLVLCIFIMFFFQFYVFLCWFCVFLYCCIIPFFHSNFT
jgi:O-antigen/teichoic acid export membrane protein